jgi:perosamine synthetase
VYVVRLHPSIDRDALMIALHERGIPTRPYFPPIHLQPHYRKAYGYGPGDLPVTESVASRTLALPFHADLPDEDIDYVCAALRELVAGG